MWFVNCIGFNHEQSDVPQNPAENRSNSNCAVSLHLWLIYSLCTIRLLLTHLILCTSLHNKWSLRIQLTGWDEIKYTVFDTPHCHIAHAGLFEKAARPNIDLENRPPDRQLYCLYTLPFSIFKELTVGHLFCVFMYMCALLHCCKVIQAQQMQEVFEFYRKTSTHTLCILKPYCDNDSDIFL